MYFKLCEYYNIKLPHCVSMPLMKRRTVLACSQDREDSFKMYYTELLCPVQLVPTSENNGAVFIIITQIMETCEEALWFVCVPNEELWFACVPKEALWFVCVPNEAPKNETVPKCSGNIKHWTIQMYEQREIKYKSNMRKTAYFYADCNPEVERPERNPSKLHKTRMFLGYSKFGQYRLKTNRSQWLTQINCLPVISQCPLASHFSRSTHDYLQNITGLQNTTYSHNSGQHSQKIPYCQQHTTKYSKSSTFYLQDTTHYTKKEVKTSTGSLPETRQCNGRQIMSMQKSSTLTLLGRHVYLEDTVTEKVQSDYVESKEKVDRLFNVPVSEQTFLCHKKAWKVWLDINSAIFGCTLSVLNFYLIIVFEKVEELLYKLVVKPNKESVTNAYLCFHVVSGAEGLKGVHCTLDKSGTAFIIVNAFLIHDSGIRHALCFISLPQTPFANYFFCRMNEPTLFHVCTSEILGSESYCLKPGFTFAPMRLGDAGEMTLVRSQSESNTSYVTCRLQKSYYLIIIYGLTARFLSPDSKESGHTWDRYDNQWIFTLLVWRNRINRRILSGTNFLTGRSTVHLAAESSPNHCRDKWLAKATCHNKGKYEVIAEATHCNSIQEEDTMQVVSFEIFLHQNLVGICHIKHEKDDLRRSTNRSKCVGNLRKTFNPGLYIEDALQETTNSNKYIDNKLEEATNRSKRTIDEMADATNRNNCNSDDENPTQQNSGWRRVTSRLIRDRPVVETIECDMVSTPTLLRASDRVYNLNSTVQADQQSPGIPSSSQIICTDGHQQSSFPEAGHNENSSTLASDPETSSPNLLYDVMFNAGVSERDVDEFLNSDADLESFILSSGFPEDLFSDEALDDGLFASLFEPDTVGNTLDEQMDVSSISDRNISDQLVAAELDYALLPPLLLDKHTSFNDIPLETCENQCYPCITLTLESGADFTSQSENNPVSSDYCQELDPSNSIVRTEILNNLSRTNIYDQYLIEFSSEHMTSPEASPPHGGSSQQSNCHTDHMIVEESRKEDFSFQENTLDIFDENASMQMQEAAEGHGETFTTNNFCPVSNNADQRCYQAESSSTKTAQPVESTCADNEATDTQLLLSSVLQRECRVIIQRINKHKITIDATTVGQSGSSKKVPRVETPGTNSARSGGRAEHKSGKRPAGGDKYNLRPRSSLRPKRR